MNESIARQIRFAEAAKSFRMLWISGGRVANFVVARDGVGSFRKLVARDGENCFQAAVQNNVIVEVRKIVDGETAEHHVGHNGTPLLV